MLFDYSNCNGEILLHDKGCLDKLLINEMQDTRGKRVEELISHSVEYGYRMHQTILSSFFFNKVNQAQERLVYLCNFYSS